jgi:DNA-binding transcriptional ArsR family regulator
MLGLTMNTDPASVEVITAPDRAALVLQKTRRQLLSHLAEPDSAAGLARRLGLPRQRLNYHLRQLEREGLVTCVEERRKGNCTERRLRATAKAFIISPDALGELGPAADLAHDRLSASYLAASAARAIQDVTALEARARREGRRLATLTLDGEVRFASAAARAAFAEELSAALVTLAARYHDEQAPHGRRFRFLTMIHPSSSAPPVRSTTGPPRRPRTRNRSTRRSSHE